MDTVGPVTPKIPADRRGMRVAGLAVTMVETSVPTPTPTEGPVYCAVEKAAAMPMDTEVANVDEVTPTTPAP